MTLDIILPKGEQPICLSEPAANSISLALSSAYICELIVLVAYKFDN
jgi:hypothetical protein